MNKKLQLAGLRFGRYLVIEEYQGAGQSTYPRWVCLCDCGTFRAVSGSALRRGGSLSCGCVSAQIQSMRKIKHGLSRSPAYNTWRNMLSRCTDPRIHNYGNYGGRGISVCTEWLEFENFYRDMGDRPPNMTLDRIDNDGNYTKENCRWASRKEQSLNTGKNRKLTLNGVTKTV